MPLGHHRSLNWAPCAIQQVPTNYFARGSVHMWRRHWRPTPALSPGNSHGRRSLVGCSPWGREESDPTERLHFHFSRSCIEEGNGNPLQCSCLENPRDGGAWWAAVYGVTQSWTRLKWLSSLAVCICYCNFLNLPLPYPPPCCVHKSVLYICVSILVLQIGS